MKKKYIKSKGMVVNGKDYKSIPKYSIEEFQDAVRKSLDYFSNSEEFKMHMLGYSLNDGNSCNDT